MTPPEDTTAVDPARPPAGSTDAPGTALPDVNVLVALAWRNHVHHRPARRWLAAEPETAWATTPVTEIGFVRVSANPRAVPTARSPREALAVLRRLCDREGHEFWADGVRLVDEPVDLARLAAYRQTTDAHLLAVAAANGGHVVTFDRGVAELAGPRSRSRVRTLVP